MEKFAKKSENFIYLQKLKTFNKDITEIATLIWRVTSKYESVNIKSQS